MEENESSGITATWKILIQLQKHAISAIVFQLLIYFIDLWDAVLSPGQHLEQDSCCQFYLMNHCLALV